MDKFTCAAGPLLAMQALGGRKAEASSQASLPTKEEKDAVGKDLRTLLKMTHGIMKSPMRQKQRTTMSMKLMSQQKMKNQKTKNMKTMSRTLKLPQR